MALTVDEIAEILNTMRVENEHNVENFEKVLTGINTKLEMMAEDSEATDLIKLYISELKKAVEDKHSDANSRFSVLENSLKNIISFQDELTKTSELTDFFHVLSSNFDRFQSEVADQKNILENFDEKLENIGGKIFNKDELSAIIVDLSRNLSEVNNRLDNSFESVENALSAVIENIKATDSTEQVNILRNSIENLSEDVKSIPERISFDSLEDKISYFQNVIDSVKSVIETTSIQSTDFISKEFKSFEDKFQNVVTDADFSALKNDLADFVGKIIDNSSALRQELVYGNERVENIFTTLNSLDYKTDLDKINAKMQELADTVNGFSQSSRYEFQNLEKNLDSIVTDSDFAGFKSDLADFVQKIIDNSTALNNELSYSTERIENILTSINSLNYKDDFDSVINRISELGTEISGINENLSNVMALKSVIDSSADNVLNKISLLEQRLANIANTDDLDNFSHDLADLLEHIKSDTATLNSDLSYGIQRIENIYEAVNSLSFKDDFSGIENKIDELKELINLVSSDNAGEFENLQKSFSAIVTDTDFAGFKSDLADFIQKIIDNSTALNNELSYSTERIENILTTVRSLDFRDDFENVVLKINELKDLFEQNSNINYTNISSEITSLSDRLNSSFDNLDIRRQEIYGSLKSDIEKIAGNLQSVIDASPQKTLEQLSALIIDISERILVLRNGIVTDIQGDYGDLKSSLGAVISNLQISKDDIISKGEQISNLSSENFNKLESKLEQQIIELNELKAAISDSGKIENSQILDTIDKSCLEISAVISDIKNNDNANYQAIKEYIDELTLSVDRLEVEFGNKFEKHSVNLLSNIQSVSDAVETFRTEFVQAVSGNLENSSKIVDGIAGITSQVSEVQQVLSDNAKNSIENSSKIVNGVETLSSKVSEMQEVLSDNSKNNFETLRFLLTSLSENLSSDIDKQKEIFFAENETNEQKKLEILQKLNEDIQNIETVISDNNNLYKNDLKNCIAELKEYIHEANNFLCENQTSTENKLVMKLESMEVFSQTFGDYVSGINSSVKNILDNIAALKSSDQNDLVKNELAALHTNSNLLLSGINDILRQNDELSNIISNLMEFVLKKEDITQLSDKLNEYSEVMFSLKEFITNSCDETSSSLSELFQKVDVAFSSIVSKNDFDNFRGELRDFLEKVLNNSEILNTNSSDNRDRIAEIADKISALEPVDYSYDLEQISAKIDDLSELFENSSNNNYLNLSEKIDNLSNEIINNNNSDLLNERLNNFSEILTSVRDVVSVAAENNTELINKQLADYEDKFSKIVSQEDFAYFREDFTGFIQSIMDSNSSLHMNLDSNSDLLGHILEKINSLDYYENFSQMSAELENLKTSFESEANKNYTNIIDGINSFKEELNTNLSDIDSVQKEKLEIINSELSDISLNIQFLKDFSSQKSMEILENISENLHSSLEELKESINLGARLDFEDLKNSVSDILNEIIKVKDDYTQKYDSSAFNISAHFNSIKLSLENLTADFSAFRDSINEHNSESSDNIISNISNISVKVDELIGEIQSTSLAYSQKVLDSVNDVSSKIEGISDGFSNVFDENMTVFKDMFSSFADNLQTLHADVSQMIKDSSDAQTFELKNISENIGDFKSQIDSAVDSLRDYISELNIASKSAKSLSDSKFSEKLLDLEAAMVNSSEVYEQKMEILQGKLAEFAQIIEGSSSDTEAKIASSIEEMSNVKEELITINDLLKAIKLSSDEKFTETVATVETGVSNIINNLNDVNNSITNNIELNFKENLFSIEEKFDKLLQIFDDSASTNNIEQIEEKLSELKQEVGLINTDITDALQNKAEDILRAFEPVKTGIDEFLGYDFENVLAELKSQLELSFMNFTVDVNGELSASTEAVSRLEQAYKETFNKISAIEECVSEKIQNNIELLNIAVETGTRDIKHVFEEKLEEYFDDLKSHLDILLNDTKTIEKIDGLKDELSVKLDSLLEEHGTLAENFENLNEFEQRTEERGRELTELVNLLSSKVDVIADDSSLKLAVSELNDKIDSITDDSKLDDALKILSEKIDIVASDTSVEDLREHLSSILDELNFKIDVIAADSSIDELQDKFDEISETENKVSEMLTALHEKVDVLAMDGSDYNLEEEIDDIKDLIFEQRKYFEATSDEKAAAIDKYLRDVLLKLDNVDLEKNSEDIKESIMNALVSLFDQISFVEETEEIKDFVEEKTDEINQNLMEVQNQLRQIASSNDDFDYSYTLQDVESDIAKLRLAINNMSDNDFESFSDDIKKIVKSVEGLESTLTQDQVVDLKSDIEKLNEDILSISSRTNKLLLTSDEAYKALNDGLNNFSSLVYRLEDRINYLDNTEISARLEKKIDNIHSMAVTSANADKVFHQVMMYLGEWIDATTENISSITDKTSEISKIKENIEELKVAIPEKTELLDEIENRFEQQELRIDRLEMKLEKILSTLEQKDDMMLNIKVDKIEKLLSRLGTNIEKLTSYVDEE